MSESDKPSLPIENYKNELRRSIQSHLEELRQSAKTHPEGFQYNVSAPMVPALELVDNFEVLSETGLASSENFKTNPNSLIGKRLGVLSILGVQPFGLDLNIEFDYHSLTGGKDFQVMVGKDITYQGVSPEIGTLALKGLLGTLNEQNVDIKKMIHLGSYTGLDYVDREGNLLPEPDQIMPPDDTRKAPTPPAEK